MKASWRTFLALTRASIQVQCTESIDVSLRIWRTVLAESRPLQLLEEIAEPIAADAAELPRIGLEVACTCNRTLGIQHATCSRTAAFGLEVACTAVNWLLEHNAIRMRGSPQTTDVKRRLDQHSNWRAYLASKRCRRRQRRQQRRSPLRRVGSRCGRLH